MASNGKNVRIQSANFSNMGDLLLRGWTMLAEGCPDCRVPLMEDPQSKSKLCVTCQTTYPKKSETLQSDMPEASSKQKGDLLSNYSSSFLPASDDRLGPYATHKDEKSWSSTQDVAGFRSCGEFPTSPTDLHADKLAAKMSAGWTLTGQYCPRCRTPLVRDKEKSMYCVSCELFTVNQSQASKLSLSPPPSTLPTPENTTSIQTQKNFGKRSNPNLSPRVDVDPPPEKKAMISEFEANLNVEDGMAVDQEEKSEKRCEKKSEGENDWKVELEAVLTAKVIQAKNLMKSECDPGCLMKYLEVINGCLDTMKRLENF